jgi:hypothetical protein
VFLKDESWKRTCLNCWIAKRNAEDPSRQQRYHQQQQQQSRQQWQAPPQQPQGKLAIDQTMLRRLIQLTHPDKHGGSEAATIATQFLLKLKGQM